MRTLGEKQSKGIMHVVANRLMEKYESCLRSNDDVTIMDGKDEGVFAWMTASHLLHAIGGSGIPSGNQRVFEKEPTFTVLDLGGGSTLNPSDEKQSSLVL
jgi:guanosine-diphosphatase